MSQEPLQVPPKIQPGELPEEITETLYRTDDPPTIIRDEVPPLLNVEDHTKAVGWSREKGHVKPKRAQRESIFHRDDYRPAVIIIFLSLLVGFFGAILGELLMSHI